MFAKLQATAAQIDSDIKTLESRLPEVMYRYTDTNPDAQPILDRHKDSQLKMAAELDEYLRDCEVFEKLSADLESTNKEIESELKKFAAEHDLTHCLVALPPMDANETLDISRKGATGSESDVDIDKSSVTPNDSFGNVVIHKELVPGQSRLFTPVVSGQPISRMKF